jgi:translation initiation factor 1
VDLGAHDVIAATIPVLVKIVAQPMWRCVAFAFGNKFVPSETSLRYRCLTTGVDSMGIVYSTGVGRICPGCRRPQAQCACKSAAGSAARANAGKVRVSRQTQSRAGKAVTLITGLPLDAAQLATLARELKRQCGSGGTVKDGAIEIQGEHRDAVVAELLRRGFDASRSGG